ncbi:unnamed protein product [Timema podura]|uniref:THUMP domain-containing protein n=1 Tax=Timema podura TaxID=61482 RepID=A0ABN7P6J7_TIMPD|nr:unnamed protein product [Timema podura]
MSGFNSYEKRRKPNYYAQQHRRPKEFSLKPGLKGFICSCNNREKECIREAYNILNEYADKFFPEQKAQVTTRPNQRKFQILESGASNFLFIQTTVPDPLLLVTKIMEDVYQTKKQKARFIQRLLPVEATCKAHIEDVRAAFEPLLDKYFTKEVKTFSIIFEKRNSHALDRNKVIEVLAEMVALKNIGNQADLKQPQLAVLVEVVRNMCLLSVLPNYYMYKKYNLFELSQTEQDKKSDEDIVSTEAGVVSSEADISTEAGVVSTEAGVVSTEAGVVSTEAGIVSTEAGVVSTEVGVVSSEADVSTEVGVVSSEADVSTEVGVVSSEVGDVIAANGDKKETDLEKD